MNREKLVEFAKFLDKDLNFLGAGYIESRTDEWINKEKTENTITIDSIKNKWNLLSDDEKNILGRPNFACCGIGKRMRDMGIEVEPKAEAEQALVIFTMLEFYKQNGMEWIGKMNEFLKKQ